MLRIDSRIGRGNSGYYDDGNRNKRGYDQQPEEFTTENQVKQWVIVIRARHIVQIKEVADPAVNEELGHSVKPLLDQRRYTWNLS